VRAAMSRYVFFLVGLSVLTGFIAYSTVATARLLRDWHPPHNPLLDRADILLRLALIALCVALGLLSGLEYITLGWVFAAPLRQLLSGLLVGGALAIGLSGVSRWTMRRAGAHVAIPRFVEMVTPRSTDELMLVGLALVPVVVLEELLFRSLLIGGLTPLFPAAALLVAVSVLFGVLHLPQGVWGMVGAGLASVVLGALFLAEQSLLAPMVAHYVANLTQLVLAMRLLRARARAANN